MLNEDLLTIGIRVLKSQSPNYIYFAEKVRRRNNSAERANRFADSRGVTCIRVLGMTWNDCFKNGMTWNDCFSNVRRRKVPTSDAASTNRWKQVAKQTPSQAAETHWRFHNSACTEGNSFPSYSYHFSCLRRFDQPASTALNRTNRREPNSPWP